MIGTPQRAMLRRVLTGASLALVFLTGAGVAAAHAAGPGPSNDAGRPAAPAAAPLTTRGFAPVTAQGVPTGQWAILAQQIGSLYLPAEIGQVFTRQMAFESENFAPGVINGTIVSPAGAQGIAQLMPASYPSVNRLDPVASLNAAARTMRDNLWQFGGDIRKALAAYDAGGVTVLSLVQRLGANWASGLPAETRQYLAAILG